MTKRDKKYDCGVHNVKEITRNYLKENRFDGLYCTNIECGCTINNLMPCECNPFDCEPGYKRLRDDGDWIIGPEKDYA